MKKVKSITRIVILTVLLAVIFSGCSYSIGSVHSESSGKIDASYVTLNDHNDKSINLKEGQKLVLDYSATVKKGTLYLSVTDTDNETLWEVELQKDGKDTVEITAKKTGTYSININGEKTGGGYHIKISKK